MRLKIEKLNSTIDKATGETLQHVAPVCGIGWFSSDEIFSIGDDHKFLRWHITSSKASIVQLISASTSGTSQIKTEFYPTCLQISPKGDVGSRNPSNAFILISTTEGKVYLLNKSSRIMKVVDAHKGAVFICRWSADALDFVTSGEDGTVKVWSKSGMLRSVLVQVGRPIYAMDWNASATKVAFCVGEECFIKPLKEQGNTVKWRAHSGVVLCLAWGSKSLLATGGEDCRYRVWDELGRPLFSSDAYTFPVTSLAWNPSSELLIVGAFNALRLCDRTGWSHTMEKPGCGSVYSVVWSADGTQIVAGCADGTLLHAHVIERRVIWENFEAIQTKPKIVEVRDVTSELSTEQLETRDRIIRLSLGYGHLVVATTKQCYIYSPKTWNTPVIIEMKGDAGITPSSANTTTSTSLSGNAVTLVALAEKCFLLAESKTNTLSIFNYEGRLQAQIRPNTSAGSGTGMTADGGEMLSDRHVALANDVLVIRDNLQHGVLHFYDVITGNIMGNRRLVHTCDIVELAVSQCGPITERRVAFVDANGDAFLAQINSYATAPSAEKIGAQVSDLTFNNVTNQLAGFQAGQLIAWTLPGIVFTDKKLLPSTIINCGAGEYLGKSATIVSFVGNTITIRRSDGSVLAFYVPPYVAGILQCAQSGNWERAVRICRIIKEEYLWATLAGLATVERNYSTAEICYGQLSETEKVLYLGEIRNETNTQLRAALMALFNGRAADADSALVQGAQIFRAIMLNLALFNFERALELAVKHNMHIDTVLGYRLRYLEQTGRRETDPKFLKHLSMVEIDWAHVCEKVSNDRSKYGTKQA